MKAATSTALQFVSDCETRLAEFGISYENLICIVTDTEPTMIKAGRLFKENSNNGCSWHGCVDHILELTTKLAFTDIDGGLDTLKACRALVGFFSHSSQADAQLKAKQIVMNNSNSKRHVPEAFVLFYLDHHYPLPLSH